MSEASQQVSIRQVFLNNSHRVWFSRSLETRHRCQSPAFVLGCRNGRIATPAGCPCGPNGLRTISHRASDRCPEILKAMQVDWSWELIYARIYGDVISETFTWYQKLEGFTWYQNDIKRSQIILYLYQILFPRQVLTPKRQWNSSDVQQPS